MGYPLTIRTGLPGNGKTLNAIKEIDTQAKSEDRPVYYHNVRDLQADKLQASWFEFEDPHLWYELPANAIILIDEAQGFFPVRDVRKPVPEHCSRFETIRHGGHEMHLVTQDHHFLDVHVRRLCNHHVHFKRVFGSNKVLRTVWSECTDFSKKGNYKSGQTTAITLDKRFFGAYSSTQQGANHHFKVRLPIAAYVLMAVVAYLSYAGYQIYQRYNQVMEPQTASKTVPAESTQQSTGMLSSVVQAVTPQLDTKEHVASAREYMDKRKPRIESIPSSAPVYDDLTKPVSFPKTYCVATINQTLIDRNLKRMMVGEHEGQRTGCSCYTQQNTRVETSFEFCMAAVENGFFDPTIPDRNAPGPGQLPQAQPQPEQLAFNSPAAQPSATPVTIVADTSRKIAR